MTYSVVIGEDRKIMKSNVVLIVFGIGVFILSLASSTLGQPKTKVEQKKPIEVEMSVKVIGGKPTGTEKGTINGKTAMLWDIREVAPPDIVICITESNTTRRCTAECSDSYSCVFTKLTVSSQTFKVEVWDMDFMEHDVIGTNTCRIDTTCTVGQAQVAIKQTCKHGASVDRSKIKKDILIDTPNENISYILIRPDGFEIKLTPKGIILGDKPYGAKLIAQQTMSFADAKMKGCFGIDESRLATQIGLHATSYKVGYNIKAANPVNVEWVDIDFDE